MDRPLLCGVSKIQFRNHIPVKGDVKNGNQDAKKTFVHLVLMLPAEV